MTLKTQTLLATVPAIRRDALAAFLHSNAMREWDVVHAETFSEMQFKLQYIAADVLLLDGTLYLAEEEEGRRWLNRHGHLATVILGESVTEAVSKDLSLSTTICLPWESLEHPPQLAAALRHAGLVRDLLANQVRLQEEVRATRLQFNELINRLWQTLTSPPGNRWYNHRQILVRLEEELDRAKRHDCMLSVAIGELSAPLASDRVLHRWRAEQIGTRKRRCDVAGDYGPRGFLLLLPHTSRHGSLICCRRLQKSLETSPQAEGLWSVLVYFGIATSSHSQGTPQALLREAEDHLALAKSAGSDRVVIGPGGVQGSFLSPGEG